MSFIWPPMLLLAWPSPRWAWLSTSCATAGGGVRIAEFEAFAGAGPERSRLVAAFAAVSRAVLFVAGMTIQDPGHRPAAERRQRAARRGHGHPLVRRLGQHGRPPTGCDPDGGCKTAARLVERQPASMLMASWPSATAGFSIGIADR